MPPLGLAPFRGYMDTLSRITWPSTVMEMVKGNHRLVPRFTTRMNRQSRNALSETRRLKLTGAPSGIATGEDDFLNGSVPDTGACRTPRVRGHIREDDGDLIGGGVGLLELEAHDGVHGASLRSVLVGDAAGELTAGRDDNAVLANIATAAVTQHAVRVPATRPRLWVGTRAVSGVVMLSSCPPAAGRDGPHRRVRALRPSSLSSGEPIRQVPGDRGRRERRDIPVPPVGEHPFAQERTASWRRVCGSALRRSASRRAHRISSRATVPSRRAPVAADGFSQRRE